MIDSDMVSLDLENMDSANIQMRLIMTKSYVDGLVDMARVLNSDAVGQDTAKYALSLLALHQERISYMEDLMSLDDSMEFSSNDQSSNT